MASDRQQDDSEDGGIPIRHTGRRFASIDPERQREVPGQGGPAADEGESADEFDPGARIADRAGGEVSAGQRSQAGNDSARQGSGEAEAPG